MLMKYFDYWYLPQTANLVRAPPNFHYAVRQFECLLSFYRALVNSTVGGEHVSRIVASLTSVLSSLYDPQRIVVAAFFAEVSIIVLHSCMTKFIDTVERQRRNCFLYSVALLMCSIAFTFFQIENETSIDEIVPVSSHTWMLWCKNYFIERTHVSCCRFNKLPGLASIYLILLSFTRFSYKFECDCSIFS